MTVGCGFGLNVPAGSVAVFSSNCFHRSGANTTQKMRRVYLAQYSAEVGARIASDPWKFIHAIGKTKRGGV